MCKVSIIVPVYNTENYLNKCLDSIMNQTLNEIEVICVNDGSEDYSLAILREYEKKDKRIKIIDKKNGGLVSARKAGVIAATGEYIGFVDSDDWIEPLMFERLYNIAIEYNVDMVSSGYIMEGGYVSYEYDSLQEGLYLGTDKNNWLDKIIFNMDDKNLGLRGSLCCKIFRSSIFKKVQEKIPNEITYSEDKMCVINYALECGSMFVKRDAWYHYMINKESMTQKPNTDYLIKVNAVYQYLTELYEHKNFSEEMQRQAEIYIVQLLIKGINSRMGFSIKNLMWINSKWMYQIEEGAKVLLFGGGELGATYERQIIHSGRLEFVGYYDDSRRANEYDYILITVKYKPRAVDIKNELLRKGISDNKIIWFEQKEIFWEYVEDAGLC